VPLYDLAAGVLSNWMAPRAERITTRWAEAKANSVLQFLGAIALYSINISRTKEGVYEVIVSARHIRR
jgi:hypothetical protein